MPGKKITDHQVHKFKHHRNTHTQMAPAARTGISERSARRIEGADSLPSQHPPRSWRTRADPLNSVWEAEISSIESRHDSLKTALDQALR